jgi:hypothetical protein
VDRPGRPRRRPPQRSRDRVGRPRDTRQDPSVSRAVLLQHSVDPLPIR